MLFNEYHSTIEKNKKEKTTRILLKGEKQKMDKLPMIVAVGAALDYKQQHPNSLDEEAMTHILRQTPGKGNDKVAAIAGATKALKFLRKNPKATKKEVMQHVMDESDSIFAGINTESD